MKLIRADKWKTYKGLNSLINICIIAEIIIISHKNNPKVGFIFTFVFTRMSSIMIHSLITKRIVFILYF